MYEHGIIMPTQTSLARHTDDSSPDSFAGQKWEHLKVPQKRFEKPHLGRLAHLIALKPMTMFGEL
jgi:hypothetical protein